jgi:hypothetical protein
LTQAEVTVRLESLLKIETKVIAIQKEVEKACKDDNEVEEQAVAYEWYDDMLNDLKVELLTIQATLEAAVVKTPTSPPSNSSNVKLPRIEIPEFTGKYEDWTSFEDLFLATYGNNQKLQDSEKLQYLKTYVKGEAAGLFKSYQITNANYAEAWDLLKNRYSNERKIVNSILKRLFSQAVMKQESSSSLRKLADTTNECVRALAVLKRPVDAWDDLLIFIVVERMDTESRSEWAMSLKGSTCPTYKELLEFLDQRVRGLQAAGTEKTSGPSQTSASNPKRDRTSSNVAGSSRQRVCHKCSQAHPTYACPELTSMSVPERVTWAAQQKLCNNCLFPGHLTKDCASRFSCRTCTQRHHTLLHLNANNTSSSGHGNGSQTSSAHCTPNIADEVAILGTLIVDVEDSTGRKQQVRVFVDGGSEDHFISEACVARLNLKREKACVFLTGIGSTPAPSIKGKTAVTLISRSQAYNLPLSVLILPTITGLIPRERCQTQWTHLEGLQLSDANFGIPSKVDILLGARKSSHIMQGGKVEDCNNPDAPVALNTRFGRMVTGSAPRISSSTSAFTVRVHHASCVESHDDLHKSVLKFWEQEEGESQIKVQSSEDVDCESHFNRTHNQNPDGTYTVKLPFREPAQVLGNSRTAAFKRFVKLEARLSKEPGLKTEYVKYMKQFKDLGYIEPVPASELKKPDAACYYIPHHVVVKPSSSSTKYRIVFDASAKTSTGVSLNSALLTGPKLQIDLQPLLLRFMSYPVALSADIWKFYPQTSVHFEDLDFQRFLWREDP